MHLLLSVGPGQQTINLFVIYAHAGAASDENLYDQNEQLFALALEEIADAGSTPSFIMGDFQTSPMSSDTLGAAVDADLIVDLHAKWCEQQEPIPAATCVPKPTSTGTRIDLVLANLAGARASQGTTVMEDSGLPTHKPLRTFLSLGHFEGTFTQDAKAKSFLSIQERYAQILDDEGDQTEFTPKTFDQLLNLEDPLPPPAQMNPQKPAR
jgi:hypothetical protein